MNPRHLWLLLGIVAMGSGFGTFFLFPVFCPMQVLGAATLIVAGYSVAAAAFYEE